MDSTSPISQSISSNLLMWWDGPLSVAIGLVILLMSGIFISNFIGNEVIISGLRGEKKMMEKTESEMISEAESVNDIRKEIKIISDRLERIEKNLDEKKNK